MIDNYGDFKIVDGLDEININDLYFDEYYSRKENVSFKLLSNCLVIKELENALKPGKFVKRYSISKAEDNNNNGFECFFYDYLYGNNINISKFIKLLRNNLINTDIFNISITEVKAVRVFSPFYKPKKINKPQKWTISHVVKAILSGQIKKGVCEMHLTDDYALDDSVNFGKGSIEVLNLCKDLVEEPSGWWINIENATDKFIELGINCYQFDYNKVYFEV